MSYFASRPEQSTTAESALLTQLNNLGAGGAGTAIQKTSATTFANVSLNPNIPTVVTIADGVTIAVNTDNGTQFNQANTQAAGTLTLTNPTGTPSDGQRFIVKIKSTNSQSLTFGTLFRGSSDFGLPTSTTGGAKNDYLGFVYNAADVKWDLVAKVFGF